MRPQGEQPLVLLGGGLARLALRQPRVPLRELFLVDGLVAVRVRLANPVQNLRICLQLLLRVPARGISASSRGWFRENSSSSSKNSENTDDKDARMIGLYRSGSPPGRSLPS